MPHTVDKHERLSLHDFQEQYAKLNKPVILTKVTEDWKAREWTPEYLAEVGRDVTVSVLATAKTCTSEGFDMSLSDYVEYLKAPDERMLYMVGWSFRGTSPQLCEDFEIPEYFQDDWLMEVPEEERPDLMWLFLGPPNSGLHMHIDVGHTAAWNVQLTGSKSWKLYPPEEENLLYNGNVDAFAPDLDRFPKYAQTNPWECTVGAGECLFVPSKWWHQTKNIEGGMALTANYADAFCHHNVSKWLRRNREYYDLHRSFRKVVQSKVGRRKRADSFKG